MMFSPAACWPWSISELVCTSDVLYWKRQRIPSNQILGTASETMQSLDTASQDFIIKLSRHWGIGNEASNSHQHLSVYHWHLVWPVSLFHQLTISQIFNNELFYLCGQWLPDWPYASRQCQHLNQLNYQHYWQVIGDLAQLNINSIVSRFPSVHLTSASLKAKPPQPHIQIIAFTDPTHRVKLFCAQSSNNREWHIHLKYLYAIMMMKMWI